MEHEAVGLFGLPEPRLTPVYRLEATLGEPLDLGNNPLGHRPSCR